MGVLDYVGEVNPSDVLAGNRCAICQRRTWGTHKGVPRYFCSKCWKEWKAEIDANVDWVYGLYRDEHARRKRRASLLKAGVMSPKSLDELMTWRQR